MKDTTKPWTWAELAKIEQKRGRAFAKFLRDYGLRGALALELTRTTEKATGHDCAVHVGPYAPKSGFPSHTIICEGCPLAMASDCEPWEPQGLYNLTKWYAKEIKKHGRLAE